MKEIVGYKVDDIRKKRQTVLIVVLIVNIVILMITTSVASADTQTFSANNQNQELVNDTQIHGIPESYQSEVRTDETTAEISQSTTADLSNPSQKQMEQTESLVIAEAQQPVAEGTSAQDMAKFDPKESETVQSDVKQAFNKDAAVTSDIMMGSAAVNAAVDQTALAHSEEAQSATKDSNEESVLSQQDFVSGQERNAIDGLLNNSTSGVSTLDAAALTYEFEKARLKGATDATVLTMVQQSGKIIPSHLTYISDFYDNKTGTSGTAFKDKTTNKVIIAYTGTNNEGNKWQDALGADIMGIGLARGQHYQPAYDFYDKIVRQYGIENIVITGHSLGGNVAQRVALKKSAVATVVYNGAPLYIPAVAFLGNKLYESLRNRFDLPSNKAEARQTIAEIKNDQKKFTGNVIRITTQKDWLNNSVRHLGGVYLGKEHVISNSGNHGLQEMIKDVKQVAEIKSLVSL